MNGLMRKNIKAVLILLFLFLLPCATTGQSPFYTEGKVIDRGDYSFIGPPGDGWLAAFKGGITLFYKDTGGSMNPLIQIVSARNDFDEKKGRYLSEEEVGLDPINRYEEGNMKNAKEANCVTYDMKKGTTVIGGKKLYFTSSIATGCTVGSASREKGLYIFIPADFSERHNYYIFFFTQFGDKGTPIEWVDLKLITPVIDSLKIKPQIEAKPNDAQSYFNRGKANIAKGQYDQAISDYTKAIELNPNSAEAYRLRGDAYLFFKGQLDLAISDYNKVLEIRPKDSGTYLNLGVAYGNKGQYDLAISDFNKALEINPSYAEAYDNRGSAYVAKGQYDQAISDFNKVLEINPRNPGAYTNRGTAYMNKGQYDQAISDHTKALEINPKFAGAYYNRGNAYMKKGQYDQAISDFNKVLEINPRDAQAYSRRGRCYYFKKEYDKSWEDVKKAQELGYKIPPEFLDDLRKASGREK
jgi:tetratricopeptide (TPR) repeat protein